MICHPHPRRGGSKDHPILWALRNALAAEDLVVLAFNFRGVMGSGGAYGGGQGEIHDLRAAIGHVRHEASDGAPTLVCGWSFGANVALREALGDDRVTALALIGIPLVPGDLSLPALPEAAALRSMRTPILLLCGEHDGFCPPDVAEELAEAVSAIELHILRGTDHYLWRREREAAEVVGSFAQRVL